MAYETTRRCRTVVMSVILILAASSNTSAQETDARWHPWLGCWQLWEEQLDPSAPTTNDETAALLNRTYVCVRPGSTPDRVDLTAVAGEQILVERTLVADASRRDVQETGCTGWEQSEWSFDGRRLFTRAELQCGDEERRTVTGVSLLSSSSIWVDIQVVELSGRQLVEVRRYNPVPAGRQDSWLGARTALGADATVIRQARREAAAPIDIRDVEEASRKSTPRVVETLLVETEPRPCPRQRHAHHARRCWNQRWHHRPARRAVVPRSFRRGAAGPRGVVVLGHVRWVRWVPRPHVV